MSTGIVYHCFGITGRGMHHVHTRFEEGRTIFRVGQDPRTLECSTCGSRKVMKKGTVFRRFMTLPIGLRPTIIEFPNPKSALLGLRDHSAGKDRLCRAGLQIHEAV